jgi:hypothetical protein
MKPNTIELGVYEVQTLPVGEFVHKVTKCKGDNCAAKGCPGYIVQQKVYKRGAYDRSSKQFQLDDVDDISRCIYVKRGTKLYAGFTY